MKRVMHIVTVAILGIGLYGADPTVLSARQTPRPGLTALVARTHGEVLRLDAASLAMRRQAFAATMAVRCAAQPQKDLDHK